MQQSIALFLKENPDLLALFFSNEGILVRIEEQCALLPPLETTQSAALCVEHAYLDDNILIISCKTALSAAALSVAGFQVSPLHTFLSFVEAPLHSRVLRAYHWFNWDQKSRYCGKCGAKLSTEMRCIPKKCVPCDLAFFPTFSPAAMVLIYRGDEILLARSKHFSPGVYSLIAGFVEIGESAEEAAHREVKEEIGISICNLQYFASQAWPFPHNLMIAFQAEYLAGELQIDPHEIEDARWFKRDALPMLPSPLSISRQLIDHFIARHPLHATDPLHPSNRRTIEQSILEAC